jgi:hypothetical protein
LNHSVVSKSDCASVSCTNGLNHSVVSKSKCASVSGTNDTTKIEAGAKRSDFIRGYVFATKKPKKKL